MASTFSPNVNLEEPARGDDSGTWDTPVNNNMTLIDLILGGVTSINMSAGSVVLSAAQFKSKTITLTSTLAANVTVTFPSTFIKSYEIQNLCTGNFTITLQTTVAGGQVICAPPGEITDCINDGTNLKYKNLSRVGSYWDYAGSSVPAWVSGCTVPPYLNCDGTTFSSATYPALTAVLGSTTLPNSKGRTRFTLDQAAGVISTATFSSSLVGATGGGQTTTMTQGNLPAIAFPVNNGAPQIGGGGALGVAAGSGTVTVAAGSDFHVYPTDTGAWGTITVGNQTAASGGSTTPFTNIPPAYIGGLTLIRAA